MNLARLHDFVKGSISALLRSFLLIMCVDAPESTTNSLSSGFNVDAGRHLFSEGEKNVALFFSFNFNTLLASFHAASRAPCSCHSVSSWDRSSEAAKMRFTWANHSERRILVSNASVTCNGSPEFYTLDWFLHVCALPENRLRRLHVLKDATQLSCVWWTAPNRSLALVTCVTANHGFPVLSYNSWFFSMDTAPLSPLFWHPLLGCSSTWRCAWEHLSPNLLLLLFLENKLSEGCHFSQNELVQVPLR